MRAAIVLGFVVLATAVAYAAPQEQPNVAVVFVIDRSGSMQGEKLDAAKEAVLAGINALEPGDRVSLVVFDSEATVVFKDLTRAKMAAIKKALKGVAPGGGTNIFPGLKEAFEILQGINAKAKHVVLFTDGEAPTDGLAELVSDMRASRITVSAVGIEGADRNMLAMIAELGEGRIYMVEDVASLAKVFAIEASQLQKARPYQRPRLFHEGNHPGPK